MIPCNEPVTVKKEQVSLESLFQFTFNIKVTSANSYWNH